MKMVFAIVNKDDSGVVSEALTQEGFFVTKIATKGGFLSAGNTTLITGTDDDKVDQVIQIIEEHSKSRKELLWRLLWAVRRSSFCPSSGSKKSKSDICKKAAERLLFYTRLMGM